ncbi:MAG: Re/Si-specific NAD(P)(+) transhydrogenase subunit alpha [Planctomycetota bacterium]|nr:MAG: Re/Si-specific NAD(P)(+) transhydrogenase subunit alpha [Planctomycetota bacterium]
MRICVPKQTDNGETRVALTPESVRKLTQRSVEVVVQHGAGQRAYFSDAEYEDAGALLVDDAAGLWREADVVVVVAPPEPDEAAQLRQGACLLGMLDPARNAPLLQALLARRATAFAFEAMPRITRAQPMDALSSMSTVAGYRAALLAAQCCPRFFPMLMTAAGTITAARVLVIGAGVAGLQALATCRRLGATVEGYDIRDAAKEQIRSVGARVVELPLDVQEAETAGGYAKALTEEQLAKQRELLAKHVAQADCLITTALAPGKPAPKIVTEQMVRAMTAGAVVVDLAAPAGGNCELTEPGDRRIVEGVTILGPTNLPAELPRDASTLYSRNALAFLELLVAEDGSLRVDMEDEVVRGAAVTHDGQATHELARTALGVEEGAQA